MEKQNSSSISLMLDRVLALHLSPFDLLQCFLLSILSIPFSPEPGPTSLSRRFAPWPLARRILGAIPRRIRESAGDEKRYHPIRFYPSLVLASHFVRSLGVCHHFCNLLVANGWKHVVLIHRDFCVPAPLPLVVYNRPRGDSNRRGNELSTWAFGCGGSQIQFGDISGSKSPALHISTELVSLLVPLAHPV
jgi:hypothetical protein